MIDVKKCIKEVNNYIANNPFIHREPLKHVFMKKLFLVYKKYRIKISKWFPLTDSQEFLWSDDNSISYGNNINSGNICLDGDNNKSKEPFLKIEYLTMMELIPKEHMKDVIKGIRLFRKKHSSDINLYNYVSEAEYFKEFFDGQAYSDIGSFTIKEKSKLSEYVRQINFCAVNLSNSFCSLNIKVSLNKKLMEDLSSYVVSNVSNQKEITGYENKKWYQFRKLNSRIFSGKNHKCETLEMIITDIKWNVLNELSRYINVLIFQSQSINIPCVSSVITNLDGYYNHNFWSSLGIDAAFCDFYNKMTAFIAWRSDDNNSPFFIYSNVNNDYKLDTDNYLLSSDIGLHLCSYLIASCVNSSIRRKLIKYSFDIAKLKNKSIRHWLESKVRISIETFYEVRFMNEYKCNIDEGYFDSFNSLKNENPMILSFYIDIEKKIKDTNEFYKDIIDLYQVNLDYRNAQSNYNMQWQSLVIAMVSVVVAVIAIVISIISSESAVKTIISFWNYWKEIFI